MKPFASIVRGTLCGLFVASLGSTSFALDASPAPSDVPSPSASLAPSATASDDAAMAALATSLVAQAQSGKIDRSLFTAKMSAALTSEMVQNASQRMSPLGKPKSVTFESGKNVGEYRAYHYRIAWESVAVDESFALDSAGKIVGWYFQPTT